MNELQLKNQNWKLNNTSELKVVKDNFNILLEILKRKNVIEGYYVEVVGGDLDVGVIAKEKEFKQ